MPTKYINADGQERVSYGDVIFREPIHYKGPCITQVFYQYDNDFGFYTSLPSQLAGDKICVWYEKNKRPKELPPRPQKGPDVPVQYQPDYTARPVEIGVKW